MVKQAKTGNIVYEALDTSNAARRLISDANVLIDLEVGGLMLELFKLPYQIQVPDIQKIS